MYELSSDSDDEPLGSLVTVADSSTSTFSRFKSEPQIDIDSCPLDWWRVHAETHKVAATLALKYLGSPATSVPSERLFSMSGHIVNKKRASLSADTVNELVCLNNWLKK